MTTARRWLLLGALAFAALSGRGSGHAQDTPGPLVPEEEIVVDGDLSESEEWPREIVTPDVRIVVYQPQIDRYEAGVIEARSAVAVTRAGDAELRFGAVWFRARMEADRDERMCRFFDVEVPRTRFVDGTPEEEAAFADIVRREVPGWVHPISMDLLLPALEAVERERATDERFSAAPPRIVVTFTPALLVPIDGEPRLGPVAGSRIRRVLNSPVVVLFDPALSTWWIDGGAAWIYASSIDGPWRAAVVAPPAIAAVATSNSERREGVPAPAAEPTWVPKVVVAREPTELVAFDGEPQWAAIVGADLSYAANTASTVFRDWTESRVYVLLSGRWFRTAAFPDGPWEFVRSDALPESFREIPEDSEVGGVLAHVAGTELAEEALLDALVPQTAAIRRDAARCEVAYDGEPRFEPIPGTDLRWAVNTSSQVLGYEDRYYCCDQGVWFVAASARGPWVLAEEVPEEFRKIPPENPHYNVKYVEIYDATPEVVYVGCTPGYLGCYGWGGSVVWGTGWTYPGWYGDFWYPRCSTWGVSVGYAPWVGDWYCGFGFSSVGGWSLGIGVSWGWGWGWGGGWWGPCGYCPPHHDSHHHPDNCRPGYDGGHGHGGKGGGGGGDGKGGGPGGRPSAGSQGRPGNVYSAPRNRPRNGPDRVGARPTSRAPEVRPAKSPTGASRTTPARTTPATGPARPQRARNDVFSDREGRIFRRDGDGSWHEKGREGWRPTPSTQRAPDVAPPTRPGTGTGTRVAPPARPGSRATAPQAPRVTRPPMRPAPTPRLQRDAWARDRGAVRIQSGGGGSRGGGARPGGGGGRPGGGGGGGGGRGGGRGR